MPLLKDVHIIVTGGTIDKIHDPHSEGLAFPDDGTSHIPDILDRGRCFAPAISEILQKDSLDFTDADREEIVRAILDTVEDAVVVTHGTGTLGDSARWAAERVTGKTVVFTGAMRPHSLGRSDASFNVGGAIIAAQTLPPGVYGVMNGRVFDAADLHKNTKLGRFDG